VLVVAVLTVTGALKQPPAVGAGAAWGVLAAEQAARGLGARPTAVRMADPNDLSRNRLVPITWRAPANGWAPYLFRSMGMSMAEALRATFIAAWALSLLGWIGVFHQGGLKGARLAALALVFASTRFVHSNAASYEGGDALLLATFPWAVLLTLFAWRPAAKVDAAGFSFSAGLFLPVLYLVKHGAAVAAGAVALAWLLQAARGGVSWKRLAIFALGAGAGSLLLDAWGNLGAPTSLMAPWDHAPNWDASWFYAWLPLAPTDLDALLRWLLMHPSRPVPFSEVWLTACGGLLLVALLALVLARPSPEGGLVAVAACPEPAATAGGLRGAWRAFRELTPPQALALTLALAAPTALALLALRGNLPDAEPRMLRPAALAGMATVFTWLLDHARFERGFRARFALALLGALFAIPLLYGASTLVDKTLLRAPPPRGFVGACGTLVDSLPPGARVSDFREDVQHLAGGRRGLIWLPTPSLATEFVEERLLVTQADTQSAATLAKLKYRGRPEGGVIVLHPDAFASDGRLAAILRAFRDVPADAWRRHKLPRCPGWSVAVCGEP
jgi:hypothetical protein